MNQSIELTTDEVGRICSVKTDYIMELVQEGILAPSAGNAPGNWRFSCQQISHARIASRLQRDLGVNLAGAALALQLLDELATLRAQLANSAFAPVDDASLIG
ncbi:MAG: chaperone modulator CbpM [Burkholderiaceae bacterium]